MKHKIPTRNPSGYADPTAYDALTPIQRDQDERERQLAMLLRVLKYTVAQADFELLARIELRDKKTGRNYR